MAENKLPDQYNLVYTLGVKPGIKRDGTVFESQEFSDGEWCRFQRGVPKKMGGYRELFSTFTGVPRGMISNAYNGVNYIFVGNQYGLEVFTGQALGLVLVVVRLLQIFSWLFAVYLSVEYYQHFCNCNGCNCSVPRWNGGYI